MFSNIAHNRLRGWQNFENLSPSSPIMGHNWKHDLARCFILKQLGPHFVMLLSKNGILGFVFQLPALFSFIVRSWTKRLCLRSSKKKFLPTVRNNEWPGWKRIGHVVSLPPTRWSTKRSKYKREILFIWQLLLERGENGGFPWKNQPYCGDAARVIKAFKPS